MPTYEYRCPAGHDFERFYRKISEAAAVVHCPVCGAEAERRLSAGAGLIFKGSGFYITDYGKDGKKKQEQPLPASGADSKGETAPSGEKPAQGGSGEGAAPSSSSASPGDKAAASAKPSKTPPGSSSSGKGE